MASLREVVQEKSLLKHPFYQLWLRGELPQKAMQQYAGQYFALVDHLPKDIRILQSNCSDAKVFQQLQHNLEEELGFGNGNVPHTELWLDFAEELGVPRGEAGRATLLPQTQKALQVIQQYCSSSLAEGAAALYAYESQVPQIAKEKIPSLQQQYGVISPKALRFFEVHAEVDKKHGAVWKALAERQSSFPESNSSSESITSAARETAQALWDMFDGMYDVFVPVESQKVCSDEKRKIFIL